MPRPRAQDYDDKRRAILRRAGALFARRGYTGASISMIARGCGMSKALLYHYYNDKESLLFDIISSHLDELIEGVERAAQAAKLPRERFHAVAAALLEAYREADDEHQVQLSALKLLPAERQEVLRAMERRLVAVFSSALGEALPAIGRDHGLLMPVTMSVFGMLNWHYLWFREGGRVSRADYARLVTEMVLAGAEAAAKAIEAPGAAHEVDLARSR
ncbi:MAG TPA: TetR/AcrR family transcriptional regulator [Stellaceae bacterium]|nr:TetR/AcrR family transcriptional regulator [Stellaceae bacterium]